MRRALYLPDFGSGERFDVRFAGHWESNGALRARLTSKGEIGLLYVVMDSVQYPLSVAC